MALYRQCWRDTRRRQKIRQAPGELRLARAGRSDEEQGVATGGGDFQGSSAELLTLNRVEVL